MKKRLKRSLESNNKQSISMKNRYDNGLIPWNFRDGAQNELNRRVRRPRWKQLANTIRERDGNICQDCGVDRNLKILQVHHVDFNPDNNSNDNLISLCISCHQIRHHQMNQISKDKLFDLYINQKLSMDDISNCLEIGKTTISRYLKYYNIPSRSLKNARKNYLNKLIK